MKIKAWTELHRIAGELQGISHVLDMTDEVDLKKLKTTVDELSTKLVTIADEEREKLEDVHIPKDKPKKAAKPTP